jgi:predicted enzyme related to lactoylglutathione lyase
VTHGSFVWNELYTRDVETAKAFYSLGWTFGGMPMSHQNRTYWIAKAGDKAVAGILDMGGIVPDSDPPHWLSDLESMTSIDAFARFRGMAAGSSGCRSISPISGALPSGQTRPAH